ncbi:kinase-like domain-containing protein [Gigaspora rosea]|uniref:Kinase-like domain-containing protein n=1 Tax=Gigaspora rosea TaxID=44941 RepID=A0A397VWP1_9GLOM|nr:kinase-like domain-containing protein [Gigaspora rosea]
MSQAVSINIETCDVTYYDPGLACIFSIKASNTSNTFSKVSFFSSGIVKESTIMNINDTAFNVDKIYQLWSGGFLLIVRLKTNNIFTGYIYDIQGNIFNIWDSPPILGNLVIPNGVFFNNTVWMFSDANSTIPNTSNWTLTTTIVKKFVDLDSKTISIKVLSSTFASSQSRYYVVMDNNFIKDLISGEPLSGARWSLTTDVEYALVRLNKGETSYFYSLSKIKRLDFLEQLKYELAYSVPLNPSNIVASSLFEWDHPVNNQILLEFQILPGSDRIKNLTVLNVVKVLNDLITNRDVTMISKLEKISKLDDQYGFRLESIGFWARYRYYLIFIGLWPFFFSNSFTISIPKIYLPQLAIQRQNFDRDSFIVKQNTDIVIEHQNRDPAIEFVNSTSLKWIPFKKLQIIKKIGEGGFATVHLAKWLNKYVALKFLRGSQNNSEGFIKEIIEPMITILIMLMQYAQRGSLRENLHEVVQIRWKLKLNILFHIAEDLQTIHSHGIIHRDLHSGNILQDNLCNAYIGDLGLSESVNKVLMRSDGIYGVFPYMAPETLRKKEYTMASDIYSFGMIMWELSSGRLSFSDKNHDLCLLLEVCEGVRPAVIEDVPQCYNDLMKRCWDNNPEKRPNASEIYKLIHYGKMRKF